MSETKRGTLLWHGSPHPDAASIEARPSLLHAVWLTGDPAVAALYAGPGGRVHGFVPAPGTRLLCSDGSRPYRDRPTNTPISPPNYPDADVWPHVSAFLEDRGYDLAEFACFDAGSISCGMTLPLGSQGQPSWEELLNDLTDMSDEAEDLLRSFGFDGLVSDERPDLALFDRRHVVETSEGHAYRALARLIFGRGRSRSMSVAMLDPSSLVHACTLDAGEVTDEALVGATKTTDFEAVSEWYAEPVPAVALRPA